MSYQIHYTECILLQREKSKEFDEIITVYSKNFGIISIVCYGLLRPTSKMKYHIEKGFVLYLELVKGREYYILVGAKKSECILKSTQLLVWQSCVKVLTQFSGEHDEDSTLIFDLWLESFRFLYEYSSTPEINITVILYFAVNMLFKAGLWPHSQYATIYDTRIDAASLVIKNHKKDIEDIIRRVINTIT